ncbi:MAG: cysteine--tRNA ligase [Candidatus Njordarchaeia archaeon]
MQGSGVAVGMLKLYNTLTKKIEEFKPLREGKVRAYFCGMTVQDEPHIGHARSFIAMDVVVRLLRYLGYKVRFIRNITDIDDKIIDKANSEGVSTFEIAERYIRKFYEASQKLKLLPPNVEPRATCHIIEIIDLVKRLVDKGYAYVAPNGDVYFDVSKYEEYGKLSGQKIEDLKKGARIEPGEYKRDPLDFALWKAAKPGEPSWPSPWGPGRPGWHIECSAMSIKYLGETFDIHGGGMDLVFPHHENEIAQSEAATGKPFARYWLHVGLVNMKGDKMSKSVGNVVRVLDLLKLYDGETIRYWAVSTHYRKPIDFSFDKLDAAEKALDKLYRYVFQLELTKEQNEDGDDISEVVKNFVRETRDRFINAMLDDINTPRAIGVLHEGIKFIDKHFDELNSSEKMEIAKIYRELGSILGILEQGFEERLEEKKSRGKEVSGLLPPNYREARGDIAPFIEILVAVRSKLRKEKQYHLADEIRERLRELGVILEDTKNGTKWKFAK